MIKAPSRLRAPSGSQLRRRRLTPWVRSRAGGSLGVLSMPGFVCSERLRSCRAYLAENIGYIRMLQLQMFRASGSLGLRSGLFHFFELPMLETQVWGMRIVGESYIPGLECS